MPERCGGISRTPHCQVVPIPPRCWWPQRQRRAAVGIGGRIAPNLVVAPRGRRLPRREDPLQRTLAASGSPWSSPTPEQEPRRVSGTSVVAKPRVACKECNDRGTEGLRKLPPGLPASQPSGQRSLQPSQLPAFVLRLFSEPTQGSTSIDSLSPASPTGVTCGRAQNPRSARPP
jgi:hypothetical protein